MFGFSKKDSRKEEKEDGGKKMTDEGVVRWNSEQWLLGIRDSRGHGPLDPVHFEPSSSFHLYQISLSESRSVRWLPRVLATLRHSLLNRRISSGAGSSEWSPFQVALVGAPVHCRLQCASRLLFLTANTAPGAGFGHASDYSTVETKHFTLAICHFSRSGDLQIPILKVSLKADKVLNTWRLLFALDILQPLLPLNSYKTWKFGVKRWSNCWLREWRGTARSSFSSVWPIHLPPF